MNTWPRLPFDAYSWTIESASEAIKKLDKSAFLHRGTGVPKEIRPFFLIKDLVPGARHEILLIYNGVEFRAHIDMESIEASRTRLFWSADFAGVLKDTFPYHYDLYTRNKQPDSSLTLRLVKTKTSDKYHALLGGEISEDIIVADIEAEEYEWCPDKKHVEGGVRGIYSRRYERNPKNRKDAIRIHGLSCNICGFNFEKCYGERGADYIEVHHVKPIHTFEEEQVVDPRTDLITVCSNCHRMIHRRRTDVLEIEELKTIYKGKQS